MKVEHSLYTRLPVRKIEKVSCLQQGMLSNRKPAWLSVWLFIAITLELVLSCSGLAATWHPTS